MRIVIEAIVENEEAKVRLCGEVEKLLRPGTILASNTSTISITRMARSLSRPQDFAGFPGNTKTRLNNIIVAGDVAENGDPATAPVVP